MARITFRPDALPELELDDEDFGPNDEYLYKQPTPGFELQLNAPRCNGKSKSVLEIWKEVNAKMTNMNILSKYLIRRQEYTPKKIIQNGPAFIVIWPDGTKTVLKRKDGDQDDIYAAFGQALMKKIFSTNSHAHKVVDRVYVNPFKKHIQDGLKEINTNSDDN